MREPGDKPQGLPATSNPLFLASLCQGLTQHPTPLHNGAGVKNQGLQTHEPVREGSFTVKPYQDLKALCCLWTNPAGPLLLLMKFPLPTAMTTASTGPGFGCFPAWVRAMSNSQIVKHYIPEKACWPGLLVEKARESLSSHPGESLFSGHRSVARSMTPESKTTNSDASQGIIHHVHRHRCQKTPWLQGCWL